MSDHTDLNCDSDWDGIPDSYADDTDSSEDDIADLLLMDTERNSAFAMTFQEMESNNVDAVQTSLGIDIDDIIENIIDTI